MFMASVDPVYCPPPWRSHLGDIEKLGVRASVNNFRFHSPIYTIFDDEFDDDDLDLPLTYFLGRNVQIR